MGEEGAPSGGGGSPGGGLPETGAPLHSSFEAHAPANPAFNSSTFKHLGGRVSQESVGWPDSSGGPSQRRQSSHFFRGDILAPAHQLHQATIAVARRTSAASGGRATLHSSTLEAATSGSIGAEHAAHYGAFAHSPEAHGAELRSTGGARSSTLSVGSNGHHGHGGGGGHGHGFRASSIISRLRARIDPHRRTRVLRRSQLSLNSRLSMASSAGAGDLHTARSMAGQVLKASYQGVKDDYQRQAIHTVLGSEEQGAATAAWMARVLGSRYAALDDAPAEHEVGADEVFFHPHSPFIAYWDILIALINFYHVGVVPIRVVFGNHDVGLLFMVEMVLCVILMADTFLSFHTGWECEGEVVMDKRRVRRRYLATWFVPEFISSLPWDLLALMDHSPDPKSYTSLSLRAPRFLGLLHWPRLWRSLKKWQDLMEDMLAIDSVLLKLLKYWVGIVMFVHAAGCLVALQAFLQRENPLSFFNRHPGDGEEGALMGRSPFVQYTYSIFRSASGLLAVGYGPSVPATLQEMWMQLVVELAGASLQLVMQAACLALVRTYDRSSSSYLQRMEAIKDFFGARDLPKPLRKGVVAQMLARHTGRQLMREEQLLRDLPPALRVDLQVHTASEVLRHTPLFSTWTPVVVRAVAAELGRGVYTAGDTIFHKGEVADCMYFVVEGAVRILDPDSGKLLTTMARGSYFGEFALLQGTRSTRTATAEAVSTCMLLSLSRAAFYRIAAHYPQVADTMSIVAAARAAVNSGNQDVRADELLRIKKSRASVLMQTCRAAVAQAIVEEGEEEEQQDLDEDEAQAFGGGPADG